MQITIKKLQDLLSSVQRKKIQTLKLKQGKFELLLNKTYKKVNQEIIPSQKSAVLQNSPSTIIKSINNTKKSSVVNEDRTEYATIVSPMVGTFYHSPAPGEKIFVQVGDEVKFNQTVCIIEAMKLMNEIEAEIEGKIIEILVKDGDIVDCGQALMKVET
uniref:Biotin carboxyl carrier protein of acetyl-CoA carboxylase n=1 Tax=Pyropia yezoensis TaxID=2788 RepID=M4QKH9_PYRYE|nr:acetyl-CoA carboxylase biotin carboxyl carrier [Neopyropia yezoensis]QFZ66945.1 acetyl-CoA carboxylase biotin carboxyl carrier [Neopyropia yezoensis]ULU28924.1 acetyl-CoA carboxylase biotin carboxyl carrier [Neopyropia yezoensis]WKD83440.1 acetyl-CoA carboxylase biotin carboxyl carrier protein [Neopyropia yezoensis]